jgi:outer membrane protein OmpA-like peptidoglycan-associated protein
MKTIIIRLAVFTLLSLSGISAYAEEPLYPAYVRNAKSLVVQAETKSLELKSFTDEVLIARNFLKSSEDEYKKNLGWSGNLDEKAEPTVRYLATMAEIQASVVLARARKIFQDKERVRLERQLVEVKSKIKVFDDKNAEIVAVKKSLTELNTAFQALKDEKEQLTAKSSTLGSDVSEKSTALASAERRVASLSSELESCTKALAVSEKKAADLASAELRAVSLASELDSCSKARSASEQKAAQLATDQEKALSEISRLKADLASLAVAKGAVESQSKEQIDALNRQKDFVAEIGKLGGVIKAGSDNMTVILARSVMLKAPKNDTLTAEGGKYTQRIADLLKAYPEYRLKLKVFGFGQPAKNEDASATDRMARLLREALLEKGKFDPATVEALGAGPVDPIYPKTNPDGNRRVEVTFVKR